MDGAGGGGVYVCVCGGVIGRVVERHSTEFSFLSLLHTVVVFFSLLPSLPLLWV